MLGKIAHFWVAYWVAKMNFKAHESAFNKVFDRIKHHEHNKSPIKAASARRVSA
jgi:hypothetical protein